MQKRSAASRRRRSRADRASRRRNGGRDRRSINLWGESASSIIIQLIDDAGIADVVCTDILVRNVVNPASVGDDFRDHRDGVVAVHFDNFVAFDAPHSRRMSNKMMESA
jgi:hypothetical protein